MIEPIDTLPALLLPALVLIALAVFMPVTGGRETRRREAWARFEATARIRGVGSADLESLTRWAQVALPYKPYNVLVRRKDFDRYARSEVGRLEACGPDTRRVGLEALAALRVTLGFLRSAGRAQSSHDLRRAEPLSYRPDAGERLLLRVEAVDERGIAIGADRPLPRSLGPGWASFARDGEGVYRFRTRPIGLRLLAHGDFLVHEERRGDPRIPLPSEPFWVAVERLPDGAAPEDPEGVEVETLDVSAGGVAFLADREVRKGSELWLDLPLSGSLDGGPKLRGVRARVLGHGIRQGGGARPHFLHCTWLDLPAAPRRVLERFVDLRLRESERA